MKNRLEVARQDFVQAFKPLRKTSRDSGALLAFEGGFLSIESDDRAAVMRASGEWQGRAYFNGSILRALAEIPPTDDPIVFERVDRGLRIANILIGCEWENVSAQFIRDVTKPDYLDLLALNHTLPRAEILGTSLARRVRTAESTLARRIAKAAKILDVAEISEGDLWALVERTVNARLGPKKK